MKVRSLIYLSVLLSFGIGLSSTQLYAAEKPHWGKAKHKCTSDDNGLVWAKLKGVKLGKKKKTCEGKGGKTPPPFKARGASGAPDYCKGKVTGVYGYWEIENDKQCSGGKKQKGSQEAYWDRAKHRCTAPGVGLVEARLKGVGGKNLGKKKDRMALCEGGNAPDLEAFGVSGQPNSCDKRLVHVYGQWENEDDPLCTPVWGEVKNKGCMGPDLDSGSGKDRQVSRAKLKKLKNGGRWWQITKWKWPLTDKKRKWSREQCLKIEHPTKGKPDYCKVKSGVWAYWYDEVQSCDKPLEWTKFKDDGCVKDMEFPNLPSTDLDPSGQRSYSARLKHVAGDWYESCRTWRVENETAKDGAVLNQSQPTGCLIQEADEVVGLIAGGALSAGTAYFVPGLGVAAAGEAAVIGAAATSAALKAMDTATSVDGVVWVNDQSCP